MKHSPAVARLIDALRTLPGVGPKTAQRMAFHLLQDGREGARRVDVVCPGFVADCLETLEEIRIRGKESFVEAGGKDLEQIPCLNEHPLWIDTLETMSREFLSKN